MKEFWFGTDRVDGVFFSRIRKIIRLWKQRKVK